MAFNLDKNDGPVKSKFDLSKADESTPEYQEPKKSNKTFLIILIIAVVVGGIYFFTKSSSKEGAELATTTNVASAATVDTQKAVIDTNSNSSKPTTTATPPKVNTPINFSKGSADVLTVDETTVNAVLDYLKSNSSAVITIEGYASSEGEAAFNNQLSENRAKNFAKYLISKGVNADNVKTIGKGIENPVASNDDEVGRSKNRRVEVKF